MAAGDRCPVLLIVEAGGVPTPAPLFRRCTERADAVSQVVCESHRLELERGAHLLSLCALSAVATKLPENPSTIH